MKISKVCSPRDKGGLESPENKVSLWRCLVCLKLSTRLTFDFNSDCKLLFLTKYFLDPCCSKMLTTQRIIVIRNKLSTQPAMAPLTFTLGCKNCVCFSHKFRISALYKLHKPPPMLMSWSPQPHFQFPLLAGDLWPLPTLMTSTRFWSPGNFTEHQTLDIIRTTVWKFGPYNPFT